MATPGLDVLPFGAQLIDPERLAHSRRMPLDVFAGRSTSASASVKPDAKPLVENVTRAPRALYKMLFFPALNEQVSAESGTQIGLP